MNKVIALLLVSFLPLDMFSEGFVAGTLVKTPDGYKTIETFACKEHIACLDCAASRLVEGKVTRVHKRRAKTCIRLIAHDCSVEMAGEQRLYIPSLKKWARAQDIAHDNELLQTLKQDYALEALQEINEEKDVYTITVSPHHNFFVTKHHILAHNWLVLELAFLFEITSLGGVAIEYSLGTTAAVFITGLVVDGINRLVRGAGGTSDIDEGDPNTIHNIAENVKKNLDNNTYIPGTGPRIVDNTSKKSLPKPEAPHNKPEDSNKPDEPTKPQEPQDPKDPKDPGTSIGTAAAAGYAAEKARDKNNTPPQTTPSQPQNTSQPTTPQQSTSPQTTPLHNSGTSTYTPAQITTPAQAQTTSPQDSTQQPTSSQTTSTYNPAVPATPHQQTHNPQPPSTQSTPVDTQTHPTLHQIAPQLNNVQQTSQTSTGTPVNHSNPVQNPISQPQNNVPQTNPTNVINPLLNQIIKSNIPLLPEVAAISHNLNKINHILTPQTGKHAWHKVVNDPKDWNQVAQVISEVMTKGVPGTHKNQALKKSLNIGKETVEVIYVVINGQVKISNAWVTP